MTQGYRDKNGTYTRRSPTSAKDPPRVNGTGPGIGGDPPDRRPRRNSRYIGLLRKMLRTRPRLIFALAVLLVGSSVTFAYLVAVTNAKTNVFTAGKLNIDVEENFDGWNTKEVRLISTNSTTKGMVRAMLVPSAKDSAGNNGRLIETAALAAPTGNKIVLGDLTFELAEDWADNWFYKDGYFYYRKLLAQEQKTEVLLKKVSLTTDNEETRAKYKNYTIDVEVLADILQPSDDAAAKWGVTVSGDTVAPKT
jgi:predicted ribosomally synthesized peptide with SipW-like signal peptide